MKKIYALINSLLIFLFIIWNYIVGTSGIHGNTVSSLSEEYSNLFTPAGYAFAIWGLIYLGLFAHGIFQLWSAFKKDKSDDFILQIGPWLSIANLAAIAWLWFWLSEQTLISVFAMIAILVSLLTAIVRLNMEKWDAPLAIIAFVWWPLSLYSGWITVASIANISAFLAKIGWQALFSEVTWTVIMIIAATIINIYMVLSRNMREFGAVGVWAIAAIAVRHWGAIPAIQWTALLCAVGLFIVIAIHGYQNRRTNPFYPAAK